MFWRSISAWSRRPTPCSRNRISDQPFREVCLMEAPVTNSITFIFNGPLLRFVDFTKEIEIAAPNLDVALQRLLERYPQLASALLDGEGRIRRAHQMFLNGETMDRRYFGDAQARSERTIQPGDSIFVLTAV